MSEGTTAEAPPRVRRLAAWLYNYRALRLSGMSRWRCVRGASAILLVDELQRRKPS